MNKSEIIDLLKGNSLYANKALGQNFLSHEETAKRIVTESGMTADDTVLEIGPGLGSLTDFLIEKGCSITAVEIDSGLYRLLQQKYSENKRITIIHADFLKSTIDGSFTGIVGNLPYYCASEIIFQAAEKYDPKIMCVMVQREMAERMASSFGEKDYGAMTISLQYRYDIKIAFHVSPSSFMPQPDVVSSVVILKRHHRFSMSEKEESVFHTLVKGAFWGRRKTIVKACTESPHTPYDKSILTDSLEESAISKSSRGESLSVESFVRLACSLSKRI